MLLQGLFPHGLFRLFVRLWLLVELLLKFVFKLFRAARGDSKSSSQNGAGLHSEHVPLELVERGSLPLSLAEVHHRGSIVALHAVDAHDADDERHLRGRQIFPHVADQVAEQVGIQVVAARMVLFGYTPPST